MPEDQGEGKMTTFKGEAPVSIGFYDVTLSEVMYYLYLPVYMEGYGDHELSVMLPPNVECCRGMILDAMTRSPRRYKYAYLSARKGWATPDNPLNRPGWHCDGFGTNDLNFVWWNGPGTRFAVGDFGEISDDHVESLVQFERAVRMDGVRQPYQSETPVPKLNVFSPPYGNLYMITPRVVHATPLIGAPGCMRQYIKISLSDERYNLENNSHNYLFDYDWPLHARDEIRNDPHKAQADYLKESAV